MNKVTSINLSGNAYQLEEEAYDLLHHYLSQAKRKLTDDPDKDEILADFEQAIAEKCDHYLHSHKTVITTKEVKKIIEDMGPVEVADPEAESATSDTMAPDRRLYLLREGAMIGGVCSGFAAYFNIDVTIVRLVFVLLAFITSGFWILIYFLLMLIIPEARTPEERAEAHGERFSANDVIEKAKQKYADISDGAHWQHVAEQTKPTFSRAGYIVLRLTRLIAGMLAVFSGIIMVGFIAVWVTVLWYLAFGHVHLYDQLQTIGLWTVAIGVTAIFYLMFLPTMLVSEASRRYALTKTFGKQSMRWASIAIVFWVGALIVLCATTVVTAQRVRNFRDTHSDFKLNGTTICINSDVCDTSDALPQPPQPPMQIE